MKLPPKITLIMPSFRGGGAERVFIDLAIGLHEKKLDVELVVLSDDGPYAKAIPDNLNIKILNSGSVKQSFWSIKKYLKQNKPEIVISCMTHLNIVVAVAKIFARSKVKLILTEHNPFSLEKASMSSISRCIFSFLVQISYTFSDKVVMVSKGIEQDFKSIFHINSNKIITIYNPIDVRRVKYLSLKDKRHVTSRPMLVSMGRLVPQKRFDILIDAFEIVVKTFPDATLHIIGTGPLETEILDKIEAKSLNKNVFLEGFKDNPFGMLSVCDLFVLSSDFEGFGNVLVEALALGRNVVSTDCPSGPNEVLEEGKYGFLVPVGAVNKLADTILYALENKKPAELLHKRAMDFDVEIAVSEYQKLIGLLLK